jgi:hypothetical protein
MNRSCRSRPPRAEQLEDRAAPSQVGPNFLAVGPAGKLVTSIPQQACVAIDVHAAQVTPEGTIVCVEEF